MKKLFVFFIPVLFFLSCKTDDPALKYTYETNPHYSWGYAEYFGSYYADYNNNNNVLSLSLFSDSLYVTNGNLSGLGQYLYIEDIFVPSDSIILPAGNYVSSELGEPFTFYPGRQYPVDDLKIDVGAFLYYIEKNKNLTVIKQVSKGSFTVKIIGSQRKIDCNFVLSDSSKVTGSFSNTLPHYNSSLQPAGVRRHKIRFDF